VARFFIEIPHEADPAECALAVKILLETGSHYLTHADWGCYDGVHKGWITAEADSKDEARRMLPPVYRDKATIVGLNKFTIDEIDEILKTHEKRA
jgi:hypothetical protein